MKRKQKELPKERNVFVAAAMFRKAGAHTKTTKAKRKNEKQKFLRDIRTGDPRGEGPGLLILYTNIVGSNPTRSSIPLF